MSDTEAHVWLAVAMFLTVFCQVALLWAYNLYPFTKRLKYIPPVRRPL